MPSYKHGARSYFYPVPRACAARGKVIALGLYIRLCLQKKIEILTFRSPLQHRKA